MENKEKELKRLRDIMPGVIGDYSYPVQKKNGLPFPNDVNTVVMFLILHELRELNKKFDECAMVVRKASV